MKKLLILVFLFSANSILHAQSRKHPYLFYTPEKISETKKRIQTDTLMRNAWQNMLATADRSLSEKGGNAEILTLAFLMTEDKKYAEKAKNILNDYLKREQWDGMDDRAPRWNSGLATARGCYISAVIFDGIYNYLTREEKKSMAEGIRKLGIIPAYNDWLSADRRLHSLNSMGHNWWSALVFEAGVASLAIMTEEPQAAEWAEEVLRSSKEWFAFSGSILENKPSNFDPAGGFYESISYANFGLSEYLTFRLAYTNAVKAVKMPYDPLIQKTIDWFIHSSYPNSKRMMSLNFGDSNDFANGERPAKLSLALGLGKEHYYRYLQEIGQSEGREDMNINTPMGLLYHPENRKAEPGLLPTAAIYKNMGWAMLRSSWQKDATFLGIKSGYTWNHAHADAGSFVLYHNGQYLLIDGGDVSYGLPEYSSYFVRSEAHNVTLFNGVAQDPQDQYHAVKTPGSLHHLINTPDLKYILADATGPTSRNFLRNYRNFLWIGNVILTIDDLKTYESGKFDFLLHYQDKAAKKGPDIEITNQNASILFRPLFPETLPLGFPHDFPEKMKLEERTGIKDRNAKAKIPYYALSPAQPAKETKLINAILLLHENNQTVQTFVGSSGASGAAGRTNLPVIEKLYDKNAIGVKITQNGKVTDVYLNLLADGRLMHRNANNTIAGWETDAYITALTYREGTDPSKPENLLEFFVSNGSYLRKNGRTLLHSLSKVFLNASFSTSETKIDFEGQPVNFISVGTPGKPSRLLVNGKQEPVLYKNQYIEIHQEN